MPRNISKEKVLKFINIPSGLGETPREILEHDFKSIKNIPISGGWGYTQKDAVIINKDDPSVIKDIPFDGPSIEKIFVEKRTYEELIIFKPDGAKFNGIKWEMLKQTLINDCKKYFDHLKYRICGHTDDDWRFLKDDYEKNNSFADNPEGRNNHNEAYSNRLFCYDTEFWFDITSFYEK